jgi:hypothetical protein
MEVLVGAQSRAILNIFADWITVVPAALLIDFLRLFTSLLF